MGMAKYAQDGWFFYFQDPQQFTPGDCSPRRKVYRTLFPIFLGFSFLRRRGAVVILFLVCM
jgi:hypothetical protein